MLLKDSCNRSQVTFEGALAVTGAAVVANFAESYLGAVVQV
jgi:hypothetical protein